MQGSRGTGSRTAFWRERGTGKSEAEPVAVSGVPGARRGKATTHVFRALHVGRGGRICTPRSLHKGEAGGPSVSSPSPAPALPLGRKGQEQKSAPEPASVPSLPHTGRHKTGAVCSAALFRWEHQEPFVTTLRGWVGDVPHLPPPVAGTRFPRHAASTRSGL